MMYKQGMKNLDASKMRFFAALRMTNNGRLTVLWFRCRGGRLPYKTFSVQLLMGLYIRKP